MELFVVFQALGIFLFGSLFIAAPSMACGNADIHLLTLRAFQPA